MKENCPATTSQKLGRNSSKSMPQRSSKYVPAVVAPSRMEMPRMTPGMTNGASIRKYRAFLPRKFSCSNRKAAHTPTTTHEMDTQTAVWKLTQMARRLSASSKMPTRFGPADVNQSRVKPRQGRDGKSESLKARTQVTKSGANRKTK